MDFYINRGYNGDKLRQILLKDKDYLKLLKEKKQKLTKSLRLTKAEEKMYVMSTDQDYEILSKVKQLEKIKLSKQDKFLVQLIRTQLERDWRKPLIKELDSILRKS